MKKDKDAKGFFYRVNRKYLTLIMENYGEIYSDSLERLERVEENLRSLNAQILEIERMKDKLKAQDVKLKVLEKKSREDIQVISSYTEETQVTKVPEKTEVYSGIDYFDFENYFRGSQAEIKKRQEIYLPYFTGCSNVMDIGCGRGEFLELLQENGIDSYGVDIYEEFVELCIQKNLRAIQGDALDVLEKEKNVGGIFAGQLVEHLAINQIVKLCEIAYDKLEEGGYIILETPNPTSLSIYTHAFYIDPSHNKPVHPLTLKYILEKAGFQKIEIMYIKGSELPIRIPELKINENENLEDFNNAMQEIQKTLFGCQDYAIIAQR